jgi:restriction system protein
MLWWKRKKPAIPGDMKRQEFELLVGEGFRLHGFLVIEMGAGGGADLVLQKGELKFLVQCQHWRAAQVDIGAVRELHGAVAARGAAGGFLVTSGELTAAATEFANASGIRPVNGPRLATMLEKARATVTMPLRIEPRLGGGGRPI